MPEPRLELDGERVTAKLLPNRGTNGGFSLVIDGTTQSHVNPDDPRDLQLEYARLVAAIVDASRPGSDPLRGLHLGGGALTLPRWVAATRPGSPQRVVELHADLYDFVVEALPLRPEVELDVVIGDAREVVERGEAGDDGTIDLAIVDVFSGSVTPRHLSTREFFAGLRRLVAPDGLIVVNTLASNGLDLARELVATLRDVVGEVVLLATPAVLEGVSLGNLVLAASASPFPVAAIADAASGGPRPIEVLAGADLDAFTGDAAVRRDEAGAG